MVKNDFEEAIARIAHEVNRAYCHALGDTSQKPWDESPEWQKRSARNGVAFHLEHPESTPEQSHVNWLVQKVAEGWVWGPVKDVDAKQHPCMKPYDELPAEQRAKDGLFVAVVRSFDAAMREIDAR